MWKKTASESVLPRLIEGMMLSCVSELELFFSAEGTLVFIFSSNF